MVLEGLEENLSAEFGNTGGTPIHDWPGDPLSLVEQSALPDLTEDAWLVLVPCRRGYVGRVGLALGREPTRELTRRVLTRALEAEPDPSLLTDELCSNSLGELLNIALGVYFSKRRIRPAVELLSPEYHQVGDLPEIKGTLNGGWGRRFETDLGTGWLLY